MGLKEILEYEIKSCSYFMSFIYLAFPRMLIRRCNRKFKRLNTYSELSALFEIKDYLKKQTTN